MPRPANNNIGTITCRYCNRPAKVRREKGGARLFYMYCPPAGEFEGCGKMTLPSKAGQDWIMENAVLDGGSAPAPEPAAPAPAPPTGSLLDAGLMAAPDHTPEPEPEPEPASKVACINLDLQPPSEPKKKARRSILLKAKDWLNEEV